MPALILLMIIVFGAAIAGLLFLVNDKEKPSPKKLLGFALVFSFLIIVLALSGTERDPEMALMILSLPGLMAVLFLGVSLAVLLRVLCTGEMVVFLRLLTVASFTATVGSALLLSSAWAVSLGLSLVTLGCLGALVVMKKPKS